MSIFKYVLIVFLYSISSLSAFAETGICEAPTLLWFADDSFCEATTSDYLRIGLNNFGEPTLQSKTQIFRHKSANTKILLVSALHYAEADYYEKIQDILDSSDLVLYEGIGGEKPTKEFLEYSAKDPSCLLLRKADMSQIGAALDLHSQMDTIQYNRTHFVRADEDISDLGSRLAAITQKNISLVQDLTFCDRMLQFYRETLGALSPNGDPIEFLIGMVQQQLNQGRAGFAQNILNSQTNAAVKKGLGDTLINSRNRLVIDKLSQYLEREGINKIAIFYGAMHMADFHDHLEALGFYPIEATWQNAFSY